MSEHATTGFFKNTINVVVEVVTKLNILTCMSFKVFFKAPLKYKFLVTNSACKSPLS